MTEKKNLHNSKALIRTIALSAGRKPIKQPRRLTKPALANAQAAKSRLG